MATSFTVYNDESLNNLNVNSINSTALVVGSLFALSLGYVEKRITVPTATAAPAEATLIRLQASDSGSHYILSQNATGAFDQVIVLPPSAPGLTFTFTVQNATSGSTISIMPQGYTIAGGNLAGGQAVAAVIVGGVTLAPATISEAYAFSIESIHSVGSLTGGFSTGAVSESINSIVGSGNVAGGIMFAAGMAASASLTLTAVSDTAVTGAVRTGTRWVGTGQVAATTNINISA